MRLENLHQPLVHLMVTLLIVYELSLTTILPRYGMAAAADLASSSLKETETVASSFTHIKNPSVMTESMNRLTRHAVQGLLKQKQQQQQKQQVEPTEYQQNILDLSSVVNSKTKRSFSNDGGWSSTTFNGLATLKGSTPQQHTFRSGSNDEAQQPVNRQQQQYTEAKPIYEEQKENDYGGASSASGPIYAQHASASVGNAAALHSAIYNLQTAGTHNTVVGASGSGSSASNGGNDGFLPSWNFGKLSQALIASQAASTPYASNDKISEGNFLHHYDSTSALNEYTPQHAYQTYQQQQQQLQMQKNENFYNSVEHTEADSSASYGDEHEHEQDNSNYPPSASSGHFINYQQHEFEQQQQQEKQPDVINYVPYPVVKKQHVPVREPVQIPVSHAVIIPVSKPVPIHIPVTQNVPVPVQQELKIPVERVVPYPVEKHVPVPVEKRVPYPVVKYVPIKIPRPFPVKVPVFKTVLHKVKKWW